MAAVSSVSHFSRKSFSTSSYFSSGERAVRCFVHARTDFAEFLEQRVEQAVAAKQTFLFAGGERAEFFEPVAFGGIQFAFAIAGKIQAQAARQNGFQNPRRFGGEQDQNGFGRRLFQRFEKGVRGLRIQAVGAGDDGDFVSGFGRLELDLLHQVAHLLDGDDARFGFGPRPMDVGVGFAVNFPAVQTFVAAIDGRAVQF